MSQLVRANPVAVNRNIAAVVHVASATPPDSAPFSYVPDLVATLLTPLVDACDPSQVRVLEKSLIVAKGTLARELAKARNTLVSILRQAPSGFLASPEATADDMLWNACSADLEQRLMRATHRANGRSKPAKVIDELLAQVRHRVELAAIQATDLVEVARIQASLPPPHSNGYEPCWGQVTAVRSFGAFVLLPSGESGLLHVSELSRGQFVEDAATLVNVGQSVHVRVQSKNKEGKLNLVLESGG